MGSLEIIVPAFNEAARLECGFSTLRTWLDTNGFADAGICLVENGSSDATPEIADALARNHARTRVIHWPYPSLAEALRRGWESSLADRLGYCDADMATDCRHIAEAMKILQEHPECVLVSGSRHLPGARVSGRNWRRRWVSALYARCVNLALGTHFTDSACGFKFLRRDWFASVADTLVSSDFALGAELMMLAERRGAGALKEIPVDWTERAGTHVRLLPTFFSSARSVLRARFAHRAFCLWTPGA